MCFCIMASLISSIVPSPSVLGRLIWIKPDLMIHGMCDNGCMLFCVCLPTGRSYGTRRLFFVFCYQYRVLTGPVSHLHISHSTFVFCIFLSHFLFFIFHFSVSNLPFHFVSS